MNERMSNTLMVVAVACAVVTTSLVAWRQVSRASQTDKQGQRVDDWREFAEGRHVLGPPSASVVIVEFLDFQCPACRRMSLTIDSLMHRGEPDVRLVRRHFPLQEIHPQAMSLALGAICAEQQGAFSEYYTTTFLNQAKTRAPEFAGPVSLMPLTVDSAAASRCIADPGTASMVQLDIAAGYRASVEATPTLLINGRRYKGSRSLASLDSLLDQAR
jgi:protein-disulfide isomerase